MGLDMTAKLVYLFTEALLPYITCCCGTIETSEIVFFNQIHISYLSLYLIKTSRHNNFKNDIR